MAGSLARKGRCDASRATSGAAARLDPERPHDLPGAGQERHRDQAADEPGQLEAGEQRDEHGERVQPRRAPDEVWHRIITGTVMAARTMPSLSADSVASTVATVAPTKGTMFRTAASAPMSSAYLTPMIDSAMAMSTPTKKLDTSCPRT